MSADVIEHIDQFLIIKEVNSFTHFFDVVLNREALGNAFNNVFGFACHKLVNFTGFTTNFHDKFGVNRNNIAAFTGGNLANIHTCHAGTVTRNAEKLCDTVASSGQCISSSIRFNTGVCRTALKGDVILGCAEESDRACNDFSGLSHHGDVA